MRGTRAIALVGAVMIGIVAAPTSAQATPASGVSATVISTTSYDGTDYTLRRITIQPGGYTGWHFHDGPLYGLVRSGKLTHVSSDCTTVHTYRTGDEIIELSGATNVHIGRNLTGRPVVLDVLYVLPTGSPFSEDAPDPGCGF